MYEPQKFIASIAQISPVLPPNKKQSTEKACEYIASAGKQGARIIVFPECFLPTYPNWSIDLSNPSEWASNLKNFTFESLTIDGPEIQQICDTAKKYSIYVVVGINERVEPYDGVIYNSLVFISEEGHVLHNHRKIFPSNREKVIHKRGEGDSLKVIHSSIGRLGGLICYEHLQPLLKYALISQGEQIHCASWPGWPHFPGGRTNKHVIDIASKQYALEAQNFVLISSLYIPPEKGAQSEFGNASWSFFGGSGIVDPMGEYIIGPIYDKEDLIFGEIDTEMIVKRKAAIDTTGRDARWNILNMNIRGREENPIEYRCSTACNYVNSIIYNINSLNNNLNTITHLLDQLNRKS